MITLRKYRDAAGRIPYDDWLGRSRDIRARKRIQIRVERLTLGLEGDWKSVGEGVRELRVPEGPGYRVYYAWDDERVVLLLCGGDKSSQQRDIDRAIHYWRDYRGR